MDVVFDIDGTLADVEHRRHWVQSKPRNWPAFARGMKDDTPKEHIVKIFKTLYKETLEYRILIASGREEEYRDITERWLGEKCAIFEYQKPFNTEWWNTYCAEGGEDGPAFYRKLYMRPLKDYRADNIVKREILDAMRGDGYNPAIVFDDRNQVVEMWRQAGLTCLQVADGNF